MRIDEDDQIGERALLALALLFLGLAIAVACTGLA